MDAWTCWKEHSQLLTSRARETVAFNGVLWDGQSHYFIDGSTERSGIIPILRFDTETQSYTAFSATVEGVTCDGTPYIPVGMDAMHERVQDTDWW